MPHPAVRLLYWGWTAVAVQALQGSLLFLLGALALVFALAYSPRRLQRLLRRARWLLLAISVLFAFGTPGILALPQFGAWGPTVDGLRLAAIHMTRLVTVLASLALLLEFTPRDEFVGALYGLMAPASRFGLDCSRVAVRLMLVMQYAEAAPEQGWRDWLAPAPPSGEQRIAIKRAPWHRRDAAALGLFALLALVWLAA